MRFYDTNALLELSEEVFKKEEVFLLSSVTFEELERIKTSVYKDESIKYKARVLLHLFNRYPEKYSVIIHRIENEDIIRNYGFSITNDTKIISDAYERFQDIHEFITNDLACATIAKVYFEDLVVTLQPTFENEYTGYVDMTFNDESLADFYSNMNNLNANFYYNLLINQYLIIRNTENEIIDKLCWTGEKFRRLKYDSFNSKWFGSIKPISGDVYQAFAADSLMNNKITLIKGPAGSGKTILSLGYLMNQLDKNNISKIIVFCNTVATKNSARLGFYPGTRDEKLLDSQIGNLLISKLGGRVAVEQMISQEKLILLPFADIRGYDTSGMNAGIYISEAQNLDISLMKLALQRIGEDCICIIDGDEKTQVDDISFEGSNNGMRRVSKVFRGHDVYGEIALKNIHRSQIAQLAENM